MIWLLYSPYYETGSFSGMRLDVENRYKTAPIRGYRNLLARSCVVLDAVPIVRNIVDSATRIDAKRTHVCFQYMYMFLTRVCYVCFR